MTKFYCVKCKEFTNTKSEEQVESTNGRFRLTGICSICGTKKNTFLNKEGKISRKSPKKLDEAREKRHQRTIKKKALAIGLKALENKDA